MKLVANRNDRAVLLTTSIASSMVFIDSTAVNTVLPAIQKSLGTGLTDAQWIVEIYTLFLGSLILMGGALGDRFGRRRVFRLGIIFFTVASICCGLAQTPLQLIAARAFQGIAAALLTPASLALLNASFPPERRAAAVGTWSSVTALAVPLGPVVGGALTDWLSWHWIFFINIPFGFAAVYALRAVERPRFDPEIAASFDIKGALAITLALGGLVYGLLEAPRAGIDNPLVLAGFALAIVGLPLFVLIESRSANPLIPLDLFRKPTFTGINLATFLLYGGLYAAMFLVPFKFISAHGYTATQAGAALLPLPLGISVLSRATGWITKRVGLVSPVVAGSIATGSGLIGLGLVPLGTSYWTGYLPFLMILGIGLGLLVAPLTTIAVNAAGEGKSGIASSLNNAVVDVGALFTIALAGMALVPFYKHELMDRLSALNLPSATLEQILSQASKLSAIELPSSLPDMLRDPIEAAIAAALAGSIGVVIAISALGCFIAAGVTALMVKPANLDPTRQRSNGV